MSAHDPIPGRRLRGEEHVGSTTDPREAQRGFDGVALDYRNRPLYQPTPSPTPWTILRAVIREDRAFIGIILVFPVWVVSLVLLVVALR